MTELPDWVGTVAGFDPGLWWRPIVCTGKERHPVEFLGVAFEHSEGRGLHWSGGPVLNEGDVGVAFQRLTADRQAAARSRGEADHLKWGNGSMYVRCPRGCTPRIPRKTFDQHVERARRVEPIWIDLSLYG